MRHDPASAAVVVMLRGLKMYGMAGAVSDLIEQGAPATVFISADLEWMDYLAKKDLIDPASRSNLLGNRLVLLFLLPLLLEDLDPLQENFAGIFLFE